MKSIGVLCMTLALSSCATVQGTLGGAISYPHETVDKVQSKHYMPKDELVIPFAPIMIGKLVLLMPQGMIKGFFHGLKNDLYFYENGNYPENYEPMRPWKSIYTNNEEYEKN